jgi:hypothetical protein
VQNLPSAQQLHHALERLLGEEVLKEVRDSRIKARLASAVAVVAVLGREAALEETALQAEMDALRALFGLEQKPAHFTETRRQIHSLNAALAIRIRTGTAPAGTFEHLWAVTEQKLAIVNPPVPKTPGQ